MTFLEFLQSDSLCALLCFVFCVVHSIISIFNARRLNKRISALCDKCGSPVIEGESHDCVLNTTQLKALSAFVAELKKGGDSDAGK